MRLHPLLLLSLLPLVFASCRSGEAALCTGDLLFVAADAQDGSMAAAIEDATGNFIHVAMLEVQADGAVWVTDATTRRGVDRHPLDTLVADFTAPDGTLPRLCVKRLREKYDFEAFLKRSRPLLGLPYDFTFLPDNRAYYCSELVQECYRRPDGAPLFEARPMNFLNAEGEMPPYWTRLFGRLGMPVPQGEPGTNPTDMAASDLLEDVPFNFF